MNIREDGWVWLEGAREQGSREGWFICISDEYLICIPTRLHRVPRDTHSLKRTHTHRAKGSVQ